jgi:HAMP domain-containing protein
MKPEHHQLLHDLLDGHDAAAQRDAVLNAGHRALRRKRHVRYLTRTLAAAAFAALAVLAINRITAPHSPTSIAGPRLAATQPAQVVSHVQEITDDELLALFPGTPVGLAEVNGKQRLIFPRPGDEARFIVHL